MKIENFKIWLRQCMDSVIAIHPVSSKIVEQEYYYGVEEYKKFLEDSLIINKQNHLSIISKSLLQGIEGYREIPKENDTVEHYNEAKFQFAVSVKIWELMEQELKGETTNPLVETEKLTIDQQTKLKWLGTPAQFGFIIQELIGKGYLDKPTSSYAKDAKIYFSLFEINTTEATLKKELSERTNSISTENARLLQITNIDKLNKKTGK